MKKDEKTLSNPARAALSALWLNPHATLTFQNVEAVASARARRVLIELEFAGMIERTITADGRETYKMTEAGAAERAARPVGPSFIQLHGDFSVSVAGSPPNREVFG